MWGMVVACLAFVVQWRVLVPVEANGQGTFDAIGVQTAIQQRGRNTPRGWGIVVGHVEGDNQEYGPDRSQGQFRKIHFTMRSGEPKKSTGHATSAANSLYGTKGVAIGVSDVHVFSSNDWLTSGYLGMGSLKPPKADDPVRVFSHSWIANPGEKASLHALARIDHVADSNHVHIVCGVDNGKQKAVPYLLGSAYNVIAVGTLTGSSGNYTRIDTEGRCKPDIVGHKGPTSFTTPKVAGIVAGLVEQADRMKTTHPTARRTDTIRSVLMAGAIKPRGWQPEEGKPLDPLLGSGLVHYNRALTILEHPVQVAGKEESAPGWGFYAVRRGGTVTQLFDVENDSEFCLSLNWNRRVVGLWLNIQAPAPPPEVAAPVPGKGDETESKLEAESEPGAVTPKQVPQIDAVKTRLQDESGQSSTVQVLTPATTAPSVPSREPQPVQKQEKSQTVRGWVPRPAICDLNLVLERETSTGWEPVAESKSEVDNVEQVYFRDLPAGRYRAQVTFPDTPMNTPKGDGLPELREINGWNFALSWWLGPALEEDGKIKRLGRSGTKTAQTSR